jgi:hypothetical protein
VALWNLLWSLLTLWAHHFLSYTGRRNCDFQAVFVIPAFTFVAGGDNSIFFNFKAIFVALQIFKAQKPT